MSSTKNKQVLKSGVWYIFGNFLVKGIGFLTTPFFARLMTKEDVGDFSNLITWVGIISIIVTFDLYSSISVARFDYRENLNEYIASNLLLGSVITIVFFLALFPFKEKVLLLFGLSDYAFYLAFVYMFFYQAIQMFQAKSQVLYRYKASLGISISCALSSSLISLLFVYAFEDQLMGRVIGYFIPFIIIGLIIYIYIIVISNHVSVKYWKYALSISIPLVFHLLAGYVLSSSDRIMIHSLVGSKAVGLYSVAYSSAMVVSILMTSMNSAWVPWSMTQIDSGKYNELRKISKIYIILFGILVFGIIMLGPEILWIMGGNSYMEALDVIPSVMIGFTFQFIYTLYVNIEQYYKKQKMVAIGTVISASVNILLNWIFIPIYGYIVAAYTTLVSYMILFLLHFLFVKYMKKSLIYDTKFNVEFLCISLGLLLLSNVLYIINWLRLFIVLIIVIGMLIIVINNRDNLFYAVKTKSLNPLIEIVKRYKGANPLHRKR